MTNKTFQPATADDSVPFSTIHVSAHIADCRVCLSIRHWRHPPALPPVQALTSRSRDQLVSAYKRWSTEDLQGRSLFLVCICASLRPG
ncbi:hypothetical protein E2C01_048490 [Portunus trituberculatus]|uniref:Uncharacterized protein n=1 Tax=Portunus trituberculatus TaxID=210409 RepID=A0A5B7GAC9_PORTR|nr:hypothetical protein [Portunus trituberculatus]